MAYVIAVLMAGLSFLMNRLFLRYIGSVTVISFGPVIEEASKTLFAYYLGAEIITVHTVFGAIEAIYDWRQGSKDNFIAPMLSLAGHSFFGAVTAGVLYLTGSIWLALTSGIFLHLAYNVTMVRLIP